ncbi:MAG TPA: GDP-mannose 4,6-dehydratase [Acetobacteraceae bacterium]|nr:GDP-mannose 4,6-dehydratase [Acetobacteraceae bacterium]
MSAAGDHPEPVLITGAGGFVGRHAIAALQVAFPHAEIIGTSSTGGEFRLLDVTDRAAVRALVAEVRPASCLHLAAVSAIGAARADPGLAWSVNLHGTLHLAEAIRDLAPACRLVHVSSAEVYGGSFRAGRALAEDALPAPMNIYAATKAAADLALGAMAADGLRVVRLRPFNHTGPGQGTAFVVAAFAWQIAQIEAGRAEPRIATGALDPERDFLDVRDICAAYAAALARFDALPNGAIINLASGTPRRIGAVLEELLELSGVKAAPVTDPARLRPADIPRACGDAGRAASLLGWKPSIPWSRTLSDVLQDCRARVAAGESLKFHTF